MELSVQEIIDSYVTSTFYKIDPVTSQEFGDVENRLGVVLPEDLKAVGAVFGGREFGYMDQNLLGSADQPESVTQRTIMLRNAVGMPHKFICLAELDEGIILLETLSASNLPTIVYWFGISAYSAFAVGEFPSYIYRTFPSYIAYFAFLLEKEQLYRKMISP